MPQPHRGAPTGAVTSTNLNSSDVLSLLQQVAAGYMAPETAATELANHTSGIQALKDFALLDVYVVHNMYHINMYLYASTQG